MRFLKLAPLFILWAAGSACGGDDPDKEPDGRVVQRYPGGGAGGGAIEGQFSLFVEKAGGGAVVADATVVVVAGGKSLTAKTNVEGRADFGDDALSGAVTVHIFHADYAFESLVNLNASVATLALTPLVPDPMPMVETAVIKGNVEGWELITETPKVAFVNPGGANIMIFPPPSRESPNQQWTKNTAVEFPGQILHDYELTIDTRATALLIDAGPLVAGRYEKHFVGFAGGISATAGATIMKDVAFTHSLDQNVTVTVSGPMGLGSPSVGLLLSLPEDGGQISLQSGTGSSLTARTPTLNGALAGSKLIGYGGMSAQNGTDSTRAYSAREATGTTAALTLQALPGKPAIAGRTVSAAAVAGATYHEFSLAKTMGGAAQWYVSVIGEPTATLPEVPAGFMDRLTGTMKLGVEAINFGPGVDLNNAKLATLASTTYDASASFTEVSF